MSVSAAQRNNIRTWNLESLVAHPSLGQGFFERDTKQIRTKKIEPTCSHNPASPGLVVYQHGRKITPLTHIVDVYFRKPNLVELPLVKRHSAYVHNLRMETRMRGLLERTFRSISTRFESNFEQDFERHKSSRALKHPLISRAKSHSSDTDVDAALSRTEAQTQTSEAGSRSPGAHREASDASDASPKDGEVISGEIGQASEEAKFVEGPDRIVLAHQEGIDSLLFALTHETITQILDTIRLSRAVAPVEEQLNDLRGTIDIEQARLGALRYDLEDPAILLAEKQSIAQLLQERERNLDKDIERMRDLETGVFSKSLRLKILRETSQKVFEQILTDAGLLEQPTAGSPTMKVDGRPASSEGALHSPDSIMLAPNEYTSSMEEPRAGAFEELERTEAATAREAYLEACNWARDAERQFMERQQVYEQDLADYGSTASRIEIDLFHVQRGRDLARNLNEAEEAWEKARVRAKALGVLSNNSYQSSNFVDDADDGYRLSQDPSGQVIKPSTATIEAWASQVVNEVASDDDTSMPDVDDWEGGSIGPSDSLSVFAEGRQRLRIDRWRSTCEATRPNE